MSSFLVENVGKADQTLPTTQFVALRPTRVSLQRRVLTLACSHDCPLGHPSPSLRHWCTGGGEYTFGSTTIQALAIRPPSYEVMQPRWLQSPVDVPTFSCTTLMHRFAIYVHHFEDMLKKGMLINTRHSALTLSSSATPDNNLTQSVTYFKRAYR